MWKRTAWSGFLIWTAGTIGIRLAGQYVLRPAQSVRVLVLYAISFGLMAVLVPRICSRLGIARELWPKAATLLILPTLILDPISCAFFPSVFPNVDPAMAGVFGGWMLICCGGGVAGVWKKVGIPD